MPPSNFEHILLVCALTGNVPNKMLLLTYNHNIWPPKNNWDWRRHCRELQPLLIRYRYWQHFGND